MKKLIFALVLMFSTNLYAADRVIQLTIKDEATNLADYDKAIQEIARIPDGPQDAQGVSAPLFTIAQWRSMWVSYLLKHHIEESKTAETVKAVPRQTIPDDRYVAVAR